MPSCASSWHLRLSAAVRTACHCSPFSRNSTCLEGVTTSEFHDNFCEPLAVAFNSCRTSFLSVLAVSTIRCGPRAGQHGRGNTASEATEPSVHAKGLHDDLGVTPICTPRVFDLPVRSDRGSVEAEKLNGMIRVMVNWVAVLLEDHSCADPKHIAQMDSVPLFATTAASAASIWLSWAPLASRGSHFPRILRAPRSSRLLCCSSRFSLSHWSGRQCPARRRRPSAPLWHLPPVSDGQLGQLWTRHVCLMLLTATPRDFRQSTSCLLLGQPRFSFLAT